MSDVPLDPLNPQVIEDQSLVEWRIKDNEAKQKIARATELVAQATAGDSATEGGIYLRLLSSVLVGRLAGSSNDAQIWATDLTRDYLAKYDLQGNPRSTTPNSPQ